MAVAVGGVFTLEMATRAKNRLIVILVEAEREAEQRFYAKNQKQFQAAADKGLVELLISANANEEGPLADDEDKKEMSKRAMAMSMVENEKEDEEEMIEETMGFGLFD